MNLDAKIRWSEDIKKKAKEQNIKFRKIYCLLGRHSALATHNKILLYKQVFKTNMDVRVCFKKNQLQIFQNKVLRSISNDAKYVRATDFH